MIEALLLEQLGLRIGLLRLRIVKKPKIEESGMPAAGEIYQIRCREQRIAIMCTHAILEHSPKDTKTRKRIISVAPDFQGRNCRAFKEPL